MYFVESGLTSGSVPFAASDFGGGGTGWISQVDEVYAIQFVDYGYRKGKGKKHVRVRNSTSDDGRVAIHVIEIALPRIANHFPVEAEIGIGWPSVEWWYYLLKFSDRFTDGEIERCAGLGMGEEVIAGLKRLNEKLWGVESRGDYLMEIDIVERDREEIESERLEARRIGEERGRKIGEKIGEERAREIGEGRGREAGKREMLLMGWLEGFHDSGQVTRGWLTPGPATLPVEFVRKWWNRAVLGVIPGVGSCDEFIEAVSRSGVRVE
jgi:hypothetical protein